LFETQTLKRFGVVAAIHRYYDAMGISVIGTRDEAAFMCDTTNTAFGPVHISANGEDATEVMWDLLTWLEKDPRLYPPEELEGAYYDFLNSRD